METIRHRALDFLESCASKRLPGAFGFWPADARPTWGGRVPEDTDDTAIFNLVLALYGRRSITELEHVVYDILMPHLHTDVDRLGPPWIQALVFPTWLGGDSARPNVIDCCVNANVLALMSWCGLKRLPGYQEACAMIDAGLRWVGHDLNRLSTLTPYYPNPMEFNYALEHAISMGVDELRPAREHLRACLARHAPDPHVQGVLCSNAYGGPLWRCTALEIARGLARCHRG